MSENTLNFVVSGGPKLPNDPRVRTLIRRHAMKNVALTRKKRGDLTVGQTCANSGPRTWPSSTTIPVRNAVSSSEPNEDSDGESLLKSEHTELVGSKPIHSQVAMRTHGAVGVLFPIEAPHLSTEYEAVRAWFQVDLKDLALLTNFNVGRGTISALSADPGRLLSLLGNRQWSYLQFVPSRYGLSCCLTTATDCLLAKLRGILMPDKKNKATELRLHSLALSSLQSSLSDPCASVAPETLCASQLLGLHALLTFSDGAVWSHHTRGSINLIKHRTPKRFDSDFDKALFAAHIGPIVFDSLVGHKPCYLAEPQWMGIFHSLIWASDTLTERSPLAISIRTQMIKLPDLWHDLDHTIRGPGLFNREAQANLLSQCIDAQQQFLDWLEDYKSYCTRMSLTLPSSHELAVRRELYGTAIECLIVVKRLLATVICLDKSPEIEAEVQALAQSLLDLQKQPSPKHSWLFMGHEMGVTQSVLLTRRQWEKSFDSYYYSCQEKRLASRKRYIDWVEMLQPR